MRLALVVIVGCAASPAPVEPVVVGACTSSIEATRLDEALARYADAEGVLAASAAVDGRAGTWLGVRGRVALDGASVSTCDRFRIYSMTKVYTAAIVLQLVEEGRLGLDDAIARWYPQLPAGVAVRHLLGHTSGLFDYIGDPDVWRARFRAWDHDALIDEVAGHPLAFAPGAAFDYSNANFLVLGRVIERVTGSTYREQLRARILDRFALRETFLEGEELEGEAAIGGVVEGSTRGPAGLAPLAFVHPSLAWSAGSLVAPASDVIGFARRLFDGAIVSPASLRAMTTPVTLSTGARSPYGLGLAVLDSTEGRYVGHGGGGACCDFSSWLGYLPERDAIIVALLSTGNISSFRLASELVLAHEP